MVGWLSGWNETITEPLGNLTIPCKTFVEPSLKLPRIFGVGGDSQKNGEKCAQIWILTKRTDVLHITIESNFLHCSICKVNFLNAQLDFNHCHEIESNILWKHQKIIKSKLYKSFNANDVQILFLFLRKIQNMSYLHEPSSSLSPRHSPLTDNVTCPSQLITLRIHCKHSSHFGSNLKGVTVYVYLSATINC